MASTLLDLVNRVRRRLRAGDTSESGFSTDELDLVLTDLLNASGDAVLGQNEWSFEVRHDGYLPTFQRTEYSGDFTIFTLPGSSRTGLLLTGSTDLGILLNSTPPPPTPRVQRVVFRSIEAVAETAFTVTVSFGSFVTNGILAEFLGSTSTFNGQMTFLANEYLLPGNVKRVVSVTHQEGQVRLEERNRSQMFDRAVQRPHETFSDRPEVVVIGGKRNGYAGSNTSQEPEQPIGTSLLIYPTPITSIILNYSYVIAYPQLAQPDDQWEGIDPMVESAIVELAYAKAMQTDVGKDVEAGVILETRALGNVRQLLAMDRQMPGQRLELGSHFGGYRYGLPGRFPRHFGSL